MLTDPLYMDQIELNCVLMQYRIPRNRPVLILKCVELFEIELFLYAKLNCLKENCF